MRVRSSEFGVGCLGALLLACLFASGLGAQTEYEKIFLDPVLKQGDLDAHAANLVPLIEQGSLPALRRWQEIEEEVSDPRAIYAALGKLAAGDFKACGRDADEFVAAWIELARNYTTDLAWQKTAQRWRGITEAACIGPFAEPDASTHDDVFGPEVLLDFGASYDGAWGPVAWKPVLHHDPLKAELNMSDQARWGGYGYYVATAIVCEGDREALLKLEVGGGAKAWLDGKCILDADARRHELADEQELAVHLHKGRNVLLIKVSAIGSVQMLLRDHGGQPLDKCVYVTPKAGDKALVIDDAPPPRISLPGSLLRIWQQRQNANGPTAACMMLAFGNEAHERGLSIQSSEAFESAAQLGAEEPLVQVQCLHWLSKSRLSSASEQRRHMRVMTTTLLGQDPALFPAVLEQAKLLGADERWRDAAALLTGALEHTPCKWRAHLALAALFYDASWPMEQEAAIKAALKDAPASLPVLRAASNFYGAQGALAREIEFDKLRLTLTPGDPDVNLSLANTLGRTGDPVGAIKHFRALTLADPGNVYLLGRLAEAYAADGKLTESLAQWDALARRSVTPEQEYYQAAVTCLQLGKEEQGVAYLEKTLAADAGHHLARRQLQRMRGESEDFWSAHALSWDEVMRHDITREQFPRANSAVVLDEQIQLVYDDGSSVSYVHIVRKVLTQEGVDARGKDQINGELVTARTVLPNGTVLEPLIQPGGIIEFPGVKIGSYLDVAYILRNDGGPLETLNGDSFFFMDMDMSEPFSVSRFVLIAPGKTPLEPVYHNLNAGDKGVTIKQAKQGQQTVRTWDIRNPRLPELEQFMPSPLEVLPWIQFVQPRDWKGQARKAASEGLGQIMETPLIETQAKLLSNGKQGDVDKARAIYEWVNANLTTEGDAWNAHQALKALAGDRQELFISLCAAAGIELGFAAVDSAPPFKMAPEERLPRPSFAYPHKDDFGEFFIVVGKSDSRVFINMQDRMRPFGELSARWFGAPAMLWHGGEYSLVHLPGGDVEKDRFENSIEITLKEDGSATLHGATAIRGERSYAAKEQMRTASEDDLRNQLEADLSQQFDGLELSECSFPKLDEVGVPLVQDYTGNVKDIATKNSDGLSLELPGEKLGRLLSILVGARKREFDIALTFSLVQYDEIRITPPEGYAFAALPEDLLYPTAPLVYELKFELDDGALVIKRKLVLGPGRFTSGEYNDLVEQVKHISQAEASVLKLVKS